MLSRTFLCWALVALGNAHSVFYDVQTKVGTIRGYYETEAKGKTPKANTVSRFEGIPYAEPPLGQLRFRKPTIKASFTHTFHATSTRPRCLGASVESSSISASAEDCLYLDIYSPGVVSDTFRSRTAVMAWIIGPDAATYGDKFINLFERIVKNEKVIVVKVNYRMGALGFLSTADSAAPGNFGLWDQRLALRWIHTNIASFGGDPARLTLVGYQSGAEHALLQALGGGNKNLFKQILIIDGQYPSLFVSDRNENFQGLAKVVNCYWKDNANTVDCLRYSTNHALTTALQDDDMLSIARKGETNQSWLMSLFHRESTFFPVDDGFFNPSVLKYLLQPRNLNVSSGLSDYSILLSVPHSGALVSEIVESIKTSTENIGSEEFHISLKTLQEVILPSFLQSLYNITNQRNMDAVINTAQFQYKDWSRLRDDSSPLKEVVATLVDITRLLPAVLLADIHSRPTGSRSNMYLYQWRHSLEHLAGDNDVNCQELLHLWGTFVRQGKPADNGQGSLYDSGHRRYGDVSCNNTPLSVKSDFWEPRTSLWLKLIPSLLTIFESQKHEEQASFSETGTDVISVKLLIEKAQRDRGIIFMLTTIVVTLLGMTGMSCICIYKRSNTYAYYSPEMTTYN